MVWLLLPCTVNQVRDLVIQRGIAAEGADNTGARILCIQVRTGGFVYARHPVTIIVAAVDHSGRQR